MKQFKEVKEESNVWKPENKGDKLHGYLEEVKRSSKYSTKIYKIRLFNENNQKQSKVLSVFGSKILDDKMDKISTGTEIQIRFNGWKKSEAGRRYKDWSVFMNEEDVVEEQKVTE